MNLTSEQQPRELQKDLDLQNYFQEFRKGVVGIDHSFGTYYGKQRQLYADWVASGRLYAPIEAIIQDKIGPTMANTHSFSIAYTFVRIFPFTSTR